MIVAFDVFRAHFTDDGVGSALQRLHKEATTGSRQQEEIFAGFRARLAPENLSAWDAQIEAYEKDQSLPDPYYRKIEGAPRVTLIRVSIALMLNAGITESEARLQLAREDSSAQEQGVMSLHDVTPAGMVIELLEIEELQYVDLLCRSCFL